MKDTKKCNKCKRKILLEDFYWNEGHPRSECKNCTYKRNLKYAKKNKAWLKMDRKKYMAEYYIKNKEKFKASKAKFLEQNPGYQKKMYAQKKMGEIAPTQNDNKTELQDQNA